MRILPAGEIKPHKVRYYLERRDAQFEEKMRDVLMVYQEGPAKCRFRMPRSPLTMFLFPPPGLLDFESANVLWLGEGG